MPTYTVNHSEIKLTATQKELIAQRISENHHTVTGANAYFAQVIFNELPRGNHFIGGKPVAEPQLFLHGQIRAGRTAAVKEKLILGLMDALTDATGLDKSHIWVYLLDLTPSQMIEYGEILPPSGKESQWFANLPARLKEKLATMEK
jgi:phenylpyruvate tautomerase PptA (4-oxalocrotonate tautomerase family)